MRRRAVIWTTGYAGDIAYRVFVVGETPTRYRCANAGSRFRRPSGDRWWEPGEAHHVPKHAVVFTPGWKAAPKHGHGRLPWTS